MQLSSNFKNISLIPFNVDYVYLNFYCKDSDVLNDIKILLRITPTIKKFIDPNQKIPDNNNEDYDQIIKAKN